ELHECHETRQELPVSDRSNRRPPPAHPKPRPARRPEPSRHNRLRYRRVWQSKYAWVQYSIRDTRSWHERRAAKGMRKYLALVHFQSNFRANTGTIGNFIQLILHGSWFHSAGSRTR